MKKLWMMVIACLFSYSAQAGDKEVFKEVYQLMLDNYIEDIDLSSFFNPVFSAIEKDDKDIHIIPEKKTVTVYYKGKIHKVYTRPTDEKNAEKWADYTDFLMTELKKISPELQNKDFELADVMLYNGVKKFNKDTKYYPALDVGQVQEKIQPYSASLQENGILYVRMGTINDYTAGEFAKTLQEYADPQGLILDLRGNKGGYLKAALEIADNFLEKGVMIFTIGRNPGQRKFYRASEGSYYKGKPIAILVDGDTASAAEAVVVALQKNNRAAIIGSQTYGKGTVQNIYALENGSSIALTTEKFLGFEKIAIDGAGVRPDICSSFYQTIEELETTRAKDVEHLECPKLVTSSALDMKIAEKFIEISNK